MSVHVVHNNYLVAPRWRFGDTHGIAGGAFFFTDALVNWKMFSPLFLGIMEPKVA